ncbi:MAG TPA: L-aspartate oxidase [Longimicrobiales bacterium]
MKQIDIDILVIGSGIAGLSYALKAAAHGRVLVVTKKERAASSTNWAQGGIASVVGDDDCPELHVRDTVVAGAGLCHGAAVRSLVEEGPARVRELIDWGVRFTHVDGRPSLGREGGHSRRRILHAADLTGREIERALLEAVAMHPAIEVLENHVAVDLLVAERDGAGRRCVGARVLDGRSGEPACCHAAVTLLATGGLGRAYRHTTNPEIATGDGVAMAYRAGATVANLEFVQFHPTALYPPGDRTILISEAVRGEGAILRTRDGEPLLDGVHPLGSLATRDVVARAIDLELKRTGEPHVWLDLSAIPPSTLERRFPFIYSACAERGIDIRSEPIPVVPAAHYACGGVLTDRDARTTLPGLYAAGEVACTGVHGANRLASNSLLEAVVYSHRAAARVPEELGRRGAGGCAEPGPAGRVPAGPADRDRWRGMVDRVRTLMWEDAGIVRSDAGLERAESALREMKIESDRDFARLRLEEKLLELRNLVDTALLVVRSARRRRESRGLHHNVDHPYRDNEHFLRDTILSAEARQEAQGR